jgi:hypothetical protein
LDLAPPPGGMPDLGGLPPLSETNSIEDDGVPIKIQEKINNITANLIDEESKKDDEDESEFMKKLKTKQKKAKHLQAADLPDDIHSFSNIKRKVGTKTYKNAGNDPYGMEKEKNSLRSLSRPPKLPSLNEEDFDITEYLDNKLVQNAQITGRIQSTLNRFDKQFGRSKKQSLIISENNSLEDDKIDET